MRLKGRTYIVHSNFIQIQACHIWLEGECSLKSKSVTMSGARAEMFSCTYCDSLSVNARELLEYRGNVLPWAAYGKKCKTNQGILS